MLFKSKLLIHLFSYTGFQAINKLVPFFLLPLFTRVLSKEELGYYTLYQTLIVIVFPLLTLGMQNAVSVNYFRLNERRFRRYISNVLYAVLLVVLIFVIVYFFVGKYISHIIQFPTIWLFVTILIVYPQFIVQLRLVLYRNQNKIKNFGMIAISNTLLTNLLGLAFIFVFHLSWKGMILGVLIGEIIVAFFSFISFYKEGLLVYQKSIRYIKDAIKVGLPVTFHQVGSWLSNAFNRILINSLLGIAATGTYGVGAVYGMIMTFVQDSFNIAYVPYLFSNLKNKNESTELRIVKISLFFYITYFFAAIAISAFGLCFTSMIFGSTYADTTTFIVPLIFASAINGFYKIHVNFLFYYKKTFSIAKITFCLGLINIPLAYFFIKSWGLLGAAYSLMIVQFFSYLLILRESNALYSMNWKKNIIYLISSFSGNIRKK